MGSLVRVSQLPLLHLEGVLMAALNSELNMGAQLHGTLPLQGSGAIDLSQCPGMSRVGWPWVLWASSGSVFLAAPMPHPAGISSRGYEWWAEPAGSCSREPFWGFRQATGPLTQLLWKLRGSPGGKAFQVTLRGTLLHPIPGPPSAHLGMCC